MSYIDTSVLVSYYCPEPRSARAEQALETATVRGLSWLVETEFAATISAKVRAGELSRSDAARVQRQFHEHVRGGVFVLWPLGYDDFARAREILSDTALRLRTLDALHLAAAAGRREELVTADRQLVTAARRLGLAVRQVA